MQIGSTTIAETFEIEICLSECRSGFLRKLNNHDEGFVASYWAAKTLQIKQIELGMRENFTEIFQHVRISTIQSGFESTVDVLLLSR